MPVKVGEFLIDVIVDAATGHLTVKSLINAMGELEVASLGGSWGLAKIASSLADLATEGMHASLALFKLSAMTGVSETKLQLWQTAAKLARMDVDAMTSSITGYSDVLGEVKLGHLYPAIFKQLGLTNIKGKTAGGELIYKQFDEMAREIAKSKGFWAMTPELQLKMLKSVGFQPQMLLALKEMRTGKFDTRLAEAARLGLSKKQLGEYAEIGDELGLISMLFKKVGHELMSGTGVFRDAIKGFREELERLLDFLQMFKGMATMRIAGGGVEGLGAAMSLDPAAALKAADVLWKTHKPAVSHLLTEVKEKVVNLHNRIVVEDKSGKKLAVIDQRHKNITGNELDKSHQQINTGGSQ